MATAGFPDPTTSFRRRVAIPPVSPVVLSVPHAGIGTDGFDGALASDLEVRSDADLYVDRLYGVDAESVGAEPRRGVHKHERGTEVFVAAQLSRFVCDMNRHPDDVSAAAVPQHPQPRNSDGRGFVWAVTTTGTPALARPLTLAEWRARQAVHAAYHGAISEALARARDRFGFALLVDGHSMPSVGRSGHSDPGRPRADIVPGDRDGTSCSPALSEMVKNHFISRSYSVSFNNPYKGGFITAEHGRPGNGIHAIQIELRRDLYMDELTFTTKPQGFQRLQSTLRDLMVTLTAWAPT